MRKIRVCPLTQRNFIGFLWSICFLRKFSYYIGCLFLCVRGSKIRRLTTNDWELLVPLNWGEINLVLCELVIKLYSWPYQAPTLHSSTPIVINIHNQMITLPVLIRDITWESLDDFLINEKTSHHATFHAVLEDYLWWPSSDYTLPKITYNLIYDLVFYGIVDECTREICSSCDND